MALGHLRLLFHAEYALVGVNLHDTRALQFLDAGLLVAHDARGLLFFGEVHELAEREEQQVVGSHH